MAVIDKRGFDGFGTIITDIPSAALTQGGNEVHMYPGSYTAPTDVVATNYAYVGIGDRDDIIIDGDMTISDSSTGTITFKNLHFRGSAAASNGGKSCIA